MEAELQRPDVLAPQLPPEVGLCSGGSERPGWGQSCGPLRGGEQDPGVRGDRQHFLFNKYVLNADSVLATLGAGQLDLRWPLLVYIPVREAKQ